jgi:hypothetical protein
MTAIHKEIAFEQGICGHLAAHGWLYEADAAARYDRARAVFPEDLVAWVQATQPEAWDSLAKSHGPAAGTVLADRLRAALDRQGTLEVLRAGLDVVGLKQRLALCQFRPALAMNDALEARYAANRLRVVRQVRYSAHSENCLDLVLFLNGIPVATVELKSHYTQKVQDALDQYRFDRLPKAPGKNVAEPLLAVPGGALVHFALSNSEAQMCTLLAGTDSKFLPFNRGHDFGAGNPPNPNGAPTAYLWEQVWQRDGWLEILGRYLVPVKDDKKKLKGWIFPRFHQLDATRKLVAQVLADGPGGKYLIEQSPHIADPSRPRLDCLRRSVARRCERIAARVASQVPRPSSICRSSLRLGRPPGQASQWARRAPQSVRTAVGIGVRVADLRVTITASPSDRSTMPRRSIQGPRTGPHLPDRSMAMPCGRERRQGRQQDPRRAAEGWEPERKVAELCQVDVFQPDCGTNRAL